MHPEEGVIHEINELIVNTLWVKVETPDTDLLQQGILDSMSLVQLLVDLEERFGVKIELQDLQIDDLRTIRSIAALVAAKTGRAKEPLHAAAREA
jgi:D-alanine--poly(phosphoribitol) ligase subunit 2